MICDLCHKNQATVHLTEIVDSAMTELHLCEECARQKSANMEQQFGLSDLLAGLAEFGTGKPQLEKETVSAKCPACKLTYADFKKIGRLGCGECYTAFKRYLAPLLKRIHGSNQHAGKTPIKTVRISRKKVDLGELKIRLAKAVEEEAFEEAARLRDAIREIEQRSQRDKLDEA